MDAFSRYVGRTTPIVRLFQMVGLPVSLAAWRRFWDGIGPLGRSDEVDHFETPGARRQIVKCPLGATQIGTITFRMTAKASGQFASE
jgi:hypothetical protein